MQEATISCVVMAAGNARRFGANKLAAALEGKPLILRALEAVPEGLFSRVEVVTQYPEVADMAAKFGFGVLRNDRPDLGLSHTIALGTQALADCGAILYMVADQPLLARETVSRVAAAWKETPERIVAAAHGGKRGNPCIFPHEFFPELLALTGDTGGSAVIKRHPDRLRTVEVPAAELADVDTPAALASLQEHR